MTSRDVEVHGEGTVEAAVRRGGEPEAVEEPDISPTFVNAGRRTQLVSTPPYALAFAAPRTRSRTETETPLRPPPTSVSAPSPPICANAPYLQVDVCNPDMPTPVQTVPGAEPIQPQPHQRTSLPDTPQTPTRHQSGPPTTTTRPNDDDEASESMRVDGWGQMQGGKGREGKED
ncbi:hypothetical protein FA13DRAFT_1793844 [Coprinellus micaceus]|uniref:Uncharacterized protein n=1 Tax=Coprinellus micaceus TaxID=71717 RepID=A0A4Y7T428_COPMI|nr:hypothetical protein FA13DRAFT_1793844 [Coprinellus micaceus]